MNLSELKIGIIGLGYVGLPLAIEFGKKYETWGYDINKDLIVSYKNQIDPSNEISKEQFISSINLLYCDNTNNLSTCNFLIVAVPTPINEQTKIPDLKYLISACKILGEVLTQKKIIHALCEEKYTPPIIVFESTVYPGMTEEVCIPKIEEVSAGLKWKIDFNVGYSPERINPGDKDRYLTKITKVVSGDTNETLNTISKVYDSILENGVYQAKSIKIAEASKIIENVQRDVNIALMNEFSIICNKLNISTNDVLEASKTKWNFLSFEPGLVGGHCISVDPYYLTHKSECVGYHPDLILTSRKINDGMGIYIANKLIKLIFKKLKHKEIKDIKISILGFAFKENCSDIRNTKVMDIIKHLNSYGLNINVYDPIINKKEVKKHYDIDLCTMEETQESDAIIIAVKHNEFFNKKHYDMIYKSINNNGILFDLKKQLVGWIPENLKKQKNVTYWGL